MVSVVDDLVGSSLIAMGDERWDLRAGLSEVEVSVPESLRQMIDRRIEQLGGEERRILAAGSVAGMEFSAASVAAAPPQTTGEGGGRGGGPARRQLLIRPLRTARGPGPT